MLQLSRAKPGNPAKASSTACHPVSKQIAKGSHGILSSLLS